MQSLEAAIEKDPDDPTLYAVYGDWLQGQGDPRGELIALQIAAWNAIDDKRAAKRAAQHLATHEAVLLGDIARYERVVLEWRCGFLRTVRFRRDADDAAVKKMLRAIVQHPSGRFVQSIEVPDATQRPGLAGRWEPGVRERAVVRLLLEEQKPTTLAALTIGSLWSAERDGDDELRTAFPRLGTFAPDWRRIAHAIDDERKVALKVNLAKVPALELVRGSVFAEFATPETLVRGLDAEIRKGRDMQVLPAMRRTFTPESLDGFVLALAKQFFDAGTPDTLRWCFELVGELGGDRAANWIADQLPRWSYPRAQQGLEMLARRAWAATIPATAIAKLFVLSADTRILPELRGEVERRLQQIAEHRRMDRAALERSVAKHVPAAREGAPTLTRGMRVRWDRKDGAGTGNVFWIGKAKHGDGTRVGITDDASGDTVWVDERDCRPA